VNGAVRKLVGLAVLAVSAVITTGCPPEPAPIVVPQISLATVTPDPVSAGATITVTLSATSTQPIFELGVSLEAPNGVAALGAPCAPVEILDASPDGRTQTDRTTCTIPPNATNGTWTAVAAARSTGLGTKDVPFAVVGGSDDQAPPAVVSYGPTARTTDTFVVTVRVQDPNGVHLTSPVNLKFAVNRIILNLPATTTLVGPDTYDLQFTVADPSGPFGPGRIDLTFTISDGVGHATTLKWRVLDQT